MTWPSTTERSPDLRADGRRRIPVSQWRAVVLRVWGRIGTDHVSLVAAGIGFYGLLAVFPAITAIVSIWGLILDPQTVASQIQALSDILPAETRAFITNQATTIAAGAGAGVNLAAIAGILLALFSTMKGVTSLIDGLNIIYGEDEKRGIIHYYLLALALTLALLLMMIGTLGLLVLLPLLVSALDFGPIFGTLVKLARWPLLALVAVAGMTILYRYGPSRRGARWRRLGSGAVAGTVLWTVASIGFSIYLQYFGAYNETYGTLGAVIALLMWFWLSSFAVLLGAEFEAAIEHRSVEDTAASTPSRARPEAGRQDRLT